ncbi:MAG: hypothetical protein L0206_25225, partial [Actinobacteria bacterium]|nr:hypothetical protein [Actinomycetota bacterium]
DQSIATIDGPSVSYDNPADFAVDRTGRVLMADVNTAATRGQVMVVTGSGTPTVLISATTLGIGGLLFITVDAQDRIFTAQTSGEIKLFDSTGAMIDGSFATGLGTSPAIAAGRGGPFGTDLYAIDIGSGSLFRIDAQGTKTTIGTGFGAVRDLEFGPDGALYVAEFDRDRVLRIDAPFPSEWIGTSGTPPDATCPAWALTDTATPEDPTLASGVLTLSTSPDLETMSYGQSAPDMATIGLLVLEARVRFVSGSSSAGNRAPASIAFTTAPDVGGLFFLGQDEIFVGSAGDVKGDSAVVDTDGSAHTYRIVVDGTASGSTMSVLYDGVPTLAGSLFTSAAVFGAVE